MNEGFRDIAANDEICIAFECIERGIMYISEWHGAQTEYYIPLLLLSNAYERILKMLLCLEYFDKHNTYPDNQYFYKNIAPKGKGHHIEILLNKILVTLNDTELYQSAPDRRADIEFLTNNTELTWLITFFTEFTGRSRYYNFNVMINDNVPDNSPWEAISQFRTDYFRNHPKWHDLLEQIDFTEFYREVHGHLIGLLQRFTRALCFCFTQGAFGKKAREISSVELFNKFLFLKNHQIGTVINHQI